MSGENDIIARHFLCTDTVPGTVLGIGDDAAIINIPDHQQLASCVDTLSVGTHFLQEDCPADIAHKALAVNLSDLAAMGARPRWFTLSLTMPEYVPSWVAAFADGLFALARRYTMQLIGGDLVRGPLSVTIQGHGLVARGAAITRYGGRAGDDVYVTGELGAAGRVWQQLQAGAKTAAIHPADQARLHRPEPRVETGLALIGKASSMIDLSDGLSSDLATLTTCSQVGAEIQLACLPLAAILSTLPLQEAWALALGAGDDYELCFTLPPRYRGHIDTMAGECPMHRIGRLIEGDTLRFLREDGTTYPLSERQGYRHF